MFEEIFFPRTAERYRSACRAAGAICRSSKGDRRQTTDLEIGPEQTHRLLPCIRRRSSRTREFPETAEAGALVGYGPRYVETYRQGARMVARILRGANPAD